MKLTKIAAATAASALALTALAACGSSDGDQAEGGSDTVTLWLAGKTDTPPKVEDWLVKEFAAQHKGKNLKVQHIDWGELIPRLNTALQSDKTPDVVEVGNTQAATFTSVGAFTDLTDKLDQLGDNIGPKSFVEAGRTTARSQLSPTTGARATSSTARRRSRMPASRCRRRSRASTRPRRSSRQTATRSSPASGSPARTGATASAGSSPTAVTSPSRRMASGSRPCRHPRASRA